MSMDNRARTRQWFELVWNQGREEAIDEMFAPGGVCHGLSEGRHALVGPAAFRQFYRPFKAAFPDVRVTVEDVMGEGDQTAARLTARGTHTGDGLGIPPTGRPVTFSAIVWTRWREGQIIEGWNELDVADVMAQLSEPSVAAVNTSSPRVAVKARG